MPGSKSMVLILILKGEYSFQTSIALRAEVVWSDVSVYCFTSLSFELRFLLLLFLNV